MKKIIASILVVCTLVFLGFVALNTEFASVDSVIKPPKIEGENYEIQAAFEAAVGEKYILKAPLSGEYRTPFIRTDIDSDKNDEVVVFYCHPDTVDFIRMNILDDNEGEWKSISDFKSSYNDVYQVQFADVDSDNHKEIIICWRNFDIEISNKIEIFKLPQNYNSEIQTVFSKNYYKYLTCDPNDDNSADIIIFDKTVSGTTNEIKGTYYNFADGIPDVTGEFTLDPTISSIGEICSDKDAETNNLRIYIDGYKADSSMTTDVVYWNNKDGYFEKAELYDFTSISTVASRNININCTDIDGDSRINIPLEEYIPGSSVITADANSVLQQQSVVKWVEYSDYELNLVSYEILNPKFGYSITINQDHYAGITVENDTVNGILTFYELIYDDLPEKEKKPKKKEEPFDAHNPEKENDKTLKGKGDALFFIFATVDANYGAYEFNGYKLIDSANGFNYYYRITDAGKERGITKETIKSMFNT